MGYSEIVIVVVVLALDTFLGIILSARFLGWGGLEYGNCVDSV